MPADPRDHLEGLVHEPTQTEGPGVDLTLAAVSVVDEPGAADFGGGELAPADTTPIEPDRRDPADDYGWWELDAGTYLIEFNETLDDSGETFWLQPREAIVARGATHPTLQVTALHPVALTVGGAGISLKENARISTLLAE